ncbi:hypothetical protein K435DRAFT_870799 [Dendrothele bispora CBS 962.96]|uniref:Nucleoporin n=1 Tax=Dendrothele bispora (strain CBS 962.96) TaxID=1314807 RepID=A0A4S8L5N0_DENBC|nr:hypothetical protein K435DRAFT_870799 [Dendrothele bispora CBS 962.96]
MNGDLLVATQLSSLFPAAQATSISIQTRRLNTPLPSVDDKTFSAEHASHSVILHTPTTGTLLLRVLHGGLIIELISLSSDIQSIRFIFPSAVLPAPGIFLWETDELHILAATVTGSLYRIVLPVNVNNALWRDATATASISEYLIKNCSDTLEGLVHAHGTHCVAIGLPNGSLLRLETEYSGIERSEEEWTETIFQAGSFLSSLTSFLPLSHSNSGAMQIISMATHPWPTDIGNIWSLSRDRVLRMWKPKLGCVVAKNLSGTSGRETSPVPGSKPLLEPQYTTSLRVFTVQESEDQLYILVFIPSISSPTFGGTFHLLVTTYQDQIEEVGTFAASKNTARCNLQDFMVIDDVLYTLWDRRGQSMVEKTLLDIETISSSEGLRAPVWSGATYAPEVELTPAYLEEVLLGQGSLTEKFFDAIMRPGMFSTLTLRTAIDQYTDACLSLPGIVPPLQLTMNYPSVAENIAAVVGCTVTLNRDPQTGALQYKNYWNALKRDWEGFIARCREIERSARWPLILGAQGEGEIIVVERERVASLVYEDLPIHIHRILELDQRITDNTYDLLGILWNLSYKAGTPMMLALEERLVELMHQEIAFPFADIMLDEARRLKFQEAFDSGEVSWLTGRLQSVADLDAAVRTCLDVIGGCDMEVKREEDEAAALALPTSNSEWFRGLTASYVVTTAHARYELCLCLMGLLFFLAEDLKGWDTSLLAEVFAVFRGVSTLRYISRQPSGTSTKQPTDDTSADDVASLLQNMQVTRNRSAHSVPTYSLIHRLVAQLGLPALDVRGAAHRFIDNSGLLQSISPAVATRAEVLFCERLRLMGYLNAAREVVSWLPRTPGASYVLARIWLNAGRADDAALLLEKLAGAFGPENALSIEDREALQQVLPAGALFDSPFSFYLYIASLFKSSVLQYQEVNFTQLAISCAPPGTDTSALWLTVMKGYIDLGLYDDAYAAWSSIPSDAQKRESISLLVYKVCENNWVNHLMTFNFSGFANEVEDALAFKARNVDPRLQPSYSRILYSWYLHRGDYRNASLTMYQRARKLHALIANNPALMTTLADEELEAYTISMNALSLADSKTMWFMLPGSVETEHEPRKRRKLARHIPDNKFSPGKYDNELVQLSDIQYDYTLLSIQLDLIRKEPSLLSSNEFLLPPESIILRLAQANRFNLAMATARSLKVDMTDLFAHLTTQCLRLSQDPDAVIQEDTSDWLLTDKVSSWPGTPADRGWRYLRQSLKRHDSGETDFKYTKIALEIVLSYQSSPPPPWLVQTLEEQHHEYLIRISLRFGNLEYAIDHTLSMIRKADSHFNRDSPKNAASTWLPYTLIDQVLAAANEQEPSPARLSELRLEVSNRVKRLQKLGNLQNLQR